MVECASFVVKWQSEGYKRQNQHKILLLSIINGDVPVMTGMLSCMPNNAV